MVYVIFSQSKIFDLLLIIYSIIVVIFFQRMIRRTIGSFEDELSFNPDPNEPAMTSLTRGIVMDHVCRSNYDPCLAAAIDWFYDADANEPAV